MTQEQLAKPHDSVPSPDPTILTTQQLMRELLALREILEAKVAGLSDVMSSRLNGMDEAVKLLQTILDRVGPQASEDADLKMHQLKELMLATFALHLEKFSSVQTQFEDRDIRVGQAAIAATTAVNAALQAAKEAVGEQNKSFSLSIDKSETSTAKQLDALQVGHQTEMRAMADQIGDVKERLTRMESTALGAGQARVEVRADNADTRGGNQLSIAVVGMIVGCGGVAIAAIGVAIALATH